MYLSDGVTVCNSVYSPIHTHVHGEVEVFPVVVIPLLVLGQPVAFDQFALWNSRVFHLRLQDTHTVVLQVVVDLHRTHTDTLIWRVQHFLLEVTVETQHLGAGGRDKKKNLTHTLSSTCSSATGLVH